VFDENSVIHPCNPTRKQKALKCKNISGLKNK